MLNKRNDNTYNTNDRKQFKMNTAQKYLVTEEIYDDIYFKTAGRELSHNEIKRRNSYRETKHLPHYLLSIED